MTKKDLLGKELSNLYAIAKQVNAHFHGSDVSFLTEKAFNVLSEYLKFSCSNEERTSEILRELEINPGNTTDSIIDEITKNLSEIVKSDHDDELKELGFYMSLNRLISYHKANAKNIDHLLKVTNTTI